MQFEQPFTHKVDAMRQIANHVSKGYCYYDKGTINLDDLLDFMQSKHLFYKVYMTAQQRWRAKQRNQPVYRLVIWVREDKDTAFWVLLGTHEKGLLWNAKDKSERLKITGYELVQLARVGKPPSWTFRMTKEAIETYENDIRNAIAKRNRTRVNQLVYLLQTAPSFRGVRTDVYQLKRFASAFWQRVRGNDEPDPFKSIYKGFLGRFKKGERYAIDCET